MSGRHFEIWTKATTWRLTSRAALILATLILWAVTVVPAAADCTAAPTGLIGWWPGDGSATNVFGTNNGTLQGGATASAAGMVGTAFGFDGTNGYVQIPDSSFLEPTNLTVETWVRFASLDSAGSGAPAGVQYIVFKQNTRSSTFEGFDLGKTRVVGNDVFRFVVSSASGQSVSVQSTTLVSTGAWYHIAGVRGSNFVQLYVNGVLERQTNVTFAQNYGNFPLYFGTSGQPTWDRKLKGNLDEVALYNRALSSNEIATIFAAGTAGKCKAPNITLQPQSQTVPPGTNVNLTVAAAGVGQLSYQWRFNGSNIFGATSVSLVLTNVQTTNQGDYVVVVANVLGAVTSQVATVTLQLPPTITSSPASLKVLEGGIATFTVVATGIEPLFYQWQKDGIDLTDNARLSGTTNSTLSITPLQFGDAGGYRALVSNPYGMATSAVATLTVATNLPPLSGSIGAWGDCDNDGLMDVLLAGTVQGVAGIPDGRFTRLYHNEGGGFFDPINGSLPQLDNAAAAWGDYDSDGDLDLLISGLADGTNGPVSVTEVYRNDGSNQFTKINAGLEALGAGSVAWVDYDNDGRLDIFETGLNAQTNFVTLLYRNLGGNAFTLAPVSLPSLANGRGYWGDLDNDGDADLLLGGSTTPQLIRNDGEGVFINRNFSFIGNSSVASTWGDADGNSGLDFFSSDCFPCPPPRVFYNDGTGALNGPLQPDIGMWAGSVAWGDVDNSGRASALVNGWVQLQFGVWGFATRVYLYNGVAWPEILSLGGRTDGSVGWVDYDGDGKLDIFITGQQLTTFWKNNIATQSDVPQSPLSPVVTFNALDAVTLSWQAPSNTPPTGRGLSYNVRVGRTPGGVDVVSPMANPATGKRQIPALGNTGAAKMLKLTELAPGTYYWSVQSIAQNFNGSLFAAEGSFVITSAPPIVIAQPTNQTVFVYNNASMSVSVIGTKPLAYQWRKGGVPFADDANIFGATTPTLTITNAQPNQGGDFDVVITNAYGATTSAVATLTVQSAPRLVVEPTDQYVFPTRPASFSASAAGALPLSYQWFFTNAPLSDGGRISGVSSPVLTIQNVGAADLGSYWLIVSNAFGSVTSAVVTLNFATTRYVNVNNGSPAAPYTNWATAATVIQNAIDASGPGDEIIVTNGTYNTGGRAVKGTMISRVAVDRPITLRSVNGPASTVIQGLGGPASSAIRCVYLTNGAGLNGFTLTGGGTRTTTGSFFDHFGGGVFCESVSAVVSNCTISGNIAYFDGAGAYSGTLNNCVISGNFATSSAGGGGGGGAASSTLNNCTISGNGATAGGGVIYSKLNNCSITGNSASSLGQGGGAYSSMLTNCVVAGNSAADYGGGAAWSTFVGCLIAGNSAGTGGGAGPGTLINCTVVANSAGNGAGVYSCTVVNSIITRNPSGGANNAAYSTFTYSCMPGLTGEGNIGTDPAFVNFDVGNYRLSSVSPCINAGTNGAVSVGADLDGRTRIEDAAVDMGAYEFHHAPFILTQPASQSVLLQSNVLFTVTTLGDEPFTYQWLKDGTNVSDGTRITGANTASLSISNLNLADGGGYRVIVTNISGSVTSAVATLTLLGLPEISAQPVSRIVPAGTNISISVTASGLATIFYQWRFNGGELFGKTNSSVSLTNVQVANAGDYDVVITNIYGAVTSSVATLTVLPAAPTITTQAVSRVASVGQTVSFTIAAKGSEPLICQWQRNGTNLSGANSFTLALSNVNSSFTGTYRAAVSNSEGFAFSTNVTLVVSPVLVWGLTNAQQIQGAGTIPASATNIMAIAASKATDAGTPCLALRADGTIVTWGGFTSVPGNTTNIVAISAGGPGTRAGENNLALRGNGTVVHWNALGNQPIPVGITNGNIVALAAGASHQLALRDDGSVFAWGSNDSGQTNVPPGATNVIAIAGGTSHSLALRADGKVIVWGVKAGSHIAAFSNVVNVTAISAGGDQSLGLLGNGNAMGVTVTNSGPQVLFYGPPPASATNLAAVSAGLAHSLALRADGTVIGWGNTNSGQINIPSIATNALAIAAGNRFSLALMNDPFAPPIPPRIGRPPLSRALKTGDNVVLNALAVGGLPLRYQWLRDGTPLAGKTNQWLALTSTHPSEAGDYQLVAINDFDSVTSVVATVTVSIPQPMLLSPGTVTNGFRFSFTSIAGVIYVVEFKDILGAGAWTELERRFGVGGVEIVTDTSANGLMRFYRVRALYAPSPKLGAATWSGGAVNFSFATVVGAQYVVEYTDQLASSQWNELQTISGTGSSVGVADPAPTGLQRFYRLRVR